MFIADILGKSFEADTCFCYETTWCMTSYISYSVCCCKFFDRDTSKITPSETMEDSLRNR